MATTPDSKPHFLNLPPEIREQVYSLIFEPETYRRHEEDEYVTYDYSKAFVLFKINRQIYNEAHKIFYDLNTFVRIETPWPQSKEHVMAEGHVPIIVQYEQAKKFKNYRLHVSIDAPAYISPEVATECFIIHIDDVGKFSRSWFYADLSHPSLNPNLRLSLRLNDPFSPAGQKHIPPALQRRLLLPWGEVKNLSQMTLAGDPEPSPKIASELKTLLKQPLPSVEYCLGECARLKREGNTELQAGRYRAALDTYKKAWEAIHITIFGRNRHVHGDAFYNVRLREAPYEGKVGQAERLILRVQLVANTCLVYLKMEAYEECIFWGMRTINTVRIGMGLDPDEDQDPHTEAIPGFLAATEMGKIYFRTALALQATDEKSEARKLARVAMEYLPGAGDQKALQQLLRDCMLRI
jgi:tetratricopeptide (TPR) repeat protein